MGDGSYSRTWTVNKGNVPGRMQPIRASELIYADKDTVFADHIFYMDYVAGITEKMRIKYGTRVFRIRGVQNVGEANKYLKLLLLEIKD